MKIATPVLLALSFAVTGSMLAAAQEASGPPQVLHIVREFLKPGKSGAIHDRSESNFVQAMARAKFPTHYVALSAMSGKTRALYLIGYPSFAAWQKDNDAMDKNAALSAELDRLGAVDGELLEAVDQSVFYYDPDTSYRPVPDLSQVRYMEVTSFHIKHGHSKDWEAIAKIVIDAHKKAGTSANWATYELAYGGDDEYLLFSADKSLADIDQGFAEGKQFQAALGEDGMKKLEDLVQQSIESSDSELFAINPGQSYAPDAWVKADPAFWKPKAAPAPKSAATPDKKPAQ